MITSQDSLINEKEVNSSQFFSPSISCVYREIWKKIYISLDSYIKSDWDENPKDVGLCYGKSKQDSLITDYVT